MGNHSRNKASGECPARDCSGGSRSYQQDITPGQIEKLPKDVQDTINNERLGAKRCQYCGCVYLTDNKDILGYLNNGIIGQGWHGR